MYVHHLQISIIHKETRDEYLDFEVSHGNLFYSFLPWQVCFLVAMETVWDITRNIDGYRESLDPLNIKCLVYL